MNRRTVIRRIGAASALTGGVTAATGVTAADVERVEVASPEDLDAGAVDHHRIVAVGDDDYFVPAGFDPAGTEFRDVSSSSHDCCIGVTGCDLSCEECYICDAL